MVAISQKKQCRAPGLDEICAEMLKLGGEEYVCRLIVIAGGIWSEEIVPSDWRKPLHIPLHKKESRTIYANYRGIAHLSIPSKVLTKVILNQLKSCTELLLCEC